MSNYRKIYERHCGLIPKDEEGRTYDVHHIDGNHENNLLENLRALTIQEHYDIHYAQEDWAACHRIAARMKLSSELLSELATKHNLKRVENGTHPFLDRERQQLNAQKRVVDGTHHFLGGEIAKKAAKRRIDEGTHHFLLNNPGKGNGGANKGKTLTPRSKPTKCTPRGPQEQVKCPHCPKIGGNNAMQRYHFDNCKFKEYTSL